MKQLHEKVDILNNLVTYMKSFFKEKEYLIRALKDKISVSEKELLQSFSTINKLMISV